MVGLAVEVGAAAARARIPDRIAAALAADEAKVDELGPVAAAGA